MVKQSKISMLIAIPITILILMLTSNIALHVQAASVAFDKSNFHNPLKIDNKYFPLKPGTTMIYNGTSDGDPTRDLFVVTNDTKQILGILTRVIHDDGYLKGDHEETTNDWFAQDDQGNVWYMGEFTTDLSNKGSHEGSWEAGVKGAKPGIVMEADPKVGDTYNQEFAKGVAEDKGTILSLNENISVPYGSFSDVLKTKDFSPLEPDIVENKYYAQNIGEIKAMSVKGESEVETLTQINGTVNNNTSTN
ncbi:MAG: hypothetical protein ABJB85_06605 [Nitrososphaerota archaeon]